MSKHSVALGIMLWVSLVTGFAAYAQAPELKPIQPPTVVFQGVFPALMGNPALIDPKVGATLALSSHVVEVVFSVNNPNDYPVVVTELNYLLYADGVPIQGMNYPNRLYVPARTTSSITTTNWVNFLSVVRFRLNQDITMPAAVQGAMATWKNVFDGKATWMVEGDMRVISEGGESVVPLRAERAPH